MSDEFLFSILVLVVGAVLLAGTFSSRLTAWLRIPAPALFLILAAIVALFLPELGPAARQIDERIVSVALVLILFDGGMRIGWRRFRDALGPIAWIGIAGTAVTAAAVAATAHFLLGFEWQVSLLLGAALSPTDPAVVFSVLGPREISGRSGTILEGESGANDPVGIALLVSLLTAGTAVGSPLLTGATEFATQMGVGTVVGILGGLALGWIMRRIHLPTGALTSVFVTAAAVVIYAGGSALHGSGFLAVFIAGILVGDIRAPFRHEVDTFSSGLASLAEIVVFVLLGLSVELQDVFEPVTFVAGLTIAVLLIVVIRPVLVGVITLPVRLTWGERAFVLWSGLKGAVPILLGMFILSADVAGGERVYAIIFIVVLISVVVQGGLVPVFARLLHIPMRLVHPRPWTVDVRFAEEPAGLQRHTVEPGSPADGSTIEDLSVGERVWISVISREGRNLPVRNTTRLQAGDVVLTQVDPDHRIDEWFTALSP
ncbi:cation:proton antiporter [Agromyces sp. MMS24-JH15]|uniref:cation:proton antiporter domain-containing protein n=1 Tax=Agromyces sp. MMS24-JH15 TaxID=3243765 RepID=UPI003748A52A